MDVNLPKYAESLVSKHPPKVANPLDKSLCIALGILPQKGDNADLGAVHNILLNYLSSYSGKQIDTIGAMTPAQIGAHYLFHLHLSDKAIDEIYHNKEKREKLSKLIIQNEAKTMSDSSFKKLLDLMLTFPNIDDLNLLMKTRPFTPTTSHEQALFGNNIKVVAKFEGGSDRPSFSFTTLRE